MANMTPPQLCEAEDVERFVLFYDPFGLFCATLLLRGAAVLAVCAWLEIMHACYLDLVVIEFGILPPPR